MDEYTYLLRICAYAPPRGIRRCPPCSSSSCSCPPAISPLLSPPSRRSSTPTTPAAVAVAVAHSSVHFLAPFPSPCAKASPPPDESIRRPTFPPPLFACEVFTLNAPTLEERALFDHDREGLSVARRSVVGHRRRERKRGGGDPLSSLLALPASVPGWVLQCELTPARRAKRRARERRASKVGWRARRTR
jgi:hypothetical protein